MSLVLPTDGGSSGVWGSILDTVFAVVDAHTHLAGSGVPIVAGALNINADLSFAANALTNAKATSFTEQAAAAVTAYVNALFVNSADNNLYFRNSSGVNVQITSGSTINVSVVGGIGGDYATVGALLSYDDATKRYLLQQEGSPRPWAGLATGDLDLYQKAVSISNKVTLKSPAALAASYTVTFPAIIPAATSYVQMSSAGALSTATVPTTRAISVGAADASLGPMTYQAATSSTPPYVLLSSLSVPGCVFECPLTFDSNNLAQLVGYTIHLNKGSSASSTITARLYTAGTTLAVTAQGVGTSNAANAPGLITLSESFTGVVVGSIYAAYVIIQISTNGQADAVPHCVFNFSPAQ